MMSFERFKEKVVNEFLDYFPEVYANATVITKEVTKNNEVLTGLCLKSNATVSVTPVVYLEPAYREMQTTGISADKIIEDLADIYLGALSMAEGMKRELAPKIDADFIKKNVVFRMVNTDLNLKMVQECVHRDVEDLSAIYFVITKMDSRGCEGFKVEKAMLESFGLTEQELYECAKVNTPEKMPVKICRIEDILLKSPMCDPFTRKMIEDSMDSVPEAERVYVVGNETDHFGANVVMFPEVLAEAANKIGSKCFVIPSSMHEVIVLSAEGMSPDGLKNLIRDTNDNHVAPQDFLSDSVYTFDPQTLEFARYDDGLGL